VQKLYLSGTRKKGRCSSRRFYDDVIRKTQAGKFYLLTCVRCCARLAGALALPS
jgi:hypothetical protein